MKMFIYYVVGVLLSVTIGFFTSENPYYGFLVGGILFTILAGIFSIFFALFNANPIEKSPYDKRKKQEKQA